VQAAAFETSMAAGPRWSRTPVPLRIGQCRDDRVAASMEPPSMGYIRPRKRGRAPIACIPFFCLARRPGWDAAAPPTSRNRGREVGGNAPTLVAAHVHI
jgi:hypothetical protein